MNAELSWFEQYAMSRTYTWEQAPQEEQNVASRK
jgi:hypothetical protein